MMYKYGVIINLEITKNFHFYGKIRNAQNDQLTILNSRACEREGIFKILSLLLVLLKS